MTKTYNYRNYSNISEAMHINNTIMSSPKFTLLDYNILCLVKSFHDANKPCYMTNEQLAKHLLSGERTIRYSIDRLCAQNLLSKSFKDGNRLKGRILTYEKDNVDLFISNMLLAAPK